MQNDVIDQLSTVAGLDADNPHVFANIDNMGLIAGTFDVSKLRQLLDARLKVTGLQRCSLTPASIIKALELQLLNTSYASLFHSGQSLFHSKDYFYFTPFINLLDDLPSDYADLTPANISKVLEEIANSEPSRLMVACAAAVTLGIQQPVEAVYVDRLLCGIPANKVGKAAALLATQDAMMTRMVEEGDIDEQSFAPDRNWDTDESSPAQTGMNGLNGSNSRDLTVNAQNGLNKNGQNVFYGNGQASLQDDNGGVIHKHFGVSSIYSPTSAYLEQQTSQALAEEKRAQKLGQGASFTVPTSNDSTKINMGAKAPYVGLVMDLNTWKNTVTPLLSSNQMLLCEATSRLPLWSQPLPSGVDKNSAAALSMVDWNLMRLHFKRLKYVISGAGACRNEIFTQLEKAGLFMITHLPENHPLFAQLMEHYVPGKFLKPLTYRRSHGSGYTSFASDQHYQDHNQQQEQNIINQQEHRRHRLILQQKLRQEHLLGTMLPECLFEGHRVRALLIYNLGHQEARRKFYVKIAQAEKAKFQYLVSNLTREFYTSLEAAKHAVHEANQNLRLCSMQNVEFRGDVRGIRLELELDLDQEKIARLIKRDCSMVIITNDTARGWDADELWLMYQRLRSQRHAPELTLQNVLPVDPFYLSSRSCHQGLMFLLSLGLLLHKATELQMRHAMAEEGISLPPFKGSLTEDSRPSLFKLNNYLKEVGPSPAVELHIHSNKVTLTKLPPVFKAIVNAMGEDWAKYYYVEAYHAQEYKGELRL